MNKQFERCRFVAARRKTIVETIEPSVDVLSMKGVVKLLSTVLCGCTIVATGRTAIVETIEPASDEAALLL